MLQTKKSTKTDSFSANLGQLPILKHFDESAIQQKVDTFRKGEKNLFWFIKLGVFGLIAYLSWVYVLPPVFAALGRLLAISATGIGIVGLVFAAPVILKGLRRLTRALHKLIIKYDPFAQLEEEKQKMLNNQTTFRISAANIATLRTEMEIEAKKSEEEASRSQNDLVKLRGKADVIKAKMDALVNSQGVEAKTTDEYVSLATEFQKILAQSQRVKNKMDQAKNFVTKYGTRANIMKKLSHKMAYVGTQIDIKIDDFQATIDMLKKDYDFGRKANAATTAAKSALGFSNDWEFDYALDVVTSTISADIAITSGNLKDIESLTSNYVLDSDDLYDNLNEIANKIKTGEDVIPQAKTYLNPEYTLTQNDKINSGGFDIFD